MRKGRNRGSNRSRRASVQTGIRIVVLLRSLTQRASSQRPCGGSIAFETGEKDRCAILVHCVPGPHPGSRSSSISRQKSASRCQLFAAIPGRCRPSRDPHSLIKNPVHIEPPAKCVHFSLNVRKLSCFNSLILERRIVADTRTHTHSLGLNDQAN